MLFVFHYPVHYAEIFDWYRFKLIETEIMAILQSLRFSISQNL